MGASSLLLEKNSLHLAEIRENEEASEALLLNDEDLLEEVDELALDELVLGRIVDKWRFRGKGGETSDKLGEANLRELFA